MLPVDGVVVGACVAAVARVGVSIQSTAEATIVLATLNKPIMVVTPAATRLPVLRVFISQCPSIVKRC